MSIKHILPGNIGLGGAPLGNMFRNIPEDEAHATVAAAWDLGVRYFDTAPLYGSGLSEIRMGEALSQYPRDQFVLSSKVGRIMLDEMEDPATRDFGEKGGLFEYGLKNKILNDYSADATLRSIEDSLKRLKTDHLDIVWIHDPAQDFYGDSWLEQFNIARTGAFRALTRLREEGVIKAWGLGVNRVEPCELTLALDEPKPDAFLLAGRYSLLDHKRALQRLMPEALEQNVDIVVGGPYSSGVLAGGEHFEYQKALCGDPPAGGAHQGHCRPSSGGCESRCAAVCPGSSGGGRRNPRLQPSGSYGGRSGRAESDHPCRFLGRDAQPESGG